MGRYKVHLVLHYDALEIEAKDTGELADMLDDRDIAALLRQELAARPDRVVIDSFELDEPDPRPSQQWEEGLTIDNGDLRDLASVLAAASEEARRPGLTVDIQLRFNGVELPVQGLLAAQAWLASSANLESALVGLSHHSELLVRESDQPEQATLASRWEPSWRQPANQDTRRASLTSRELSERLDQLIEADELRELLSQHDDQPAPRVHLALHGRLALTTKQKYALRQQLDQALSVIPTLNVPQWRS